ncbi:hypothetical protein [Kitasatospora cheerisanensis]|uniref:Uncharacterized protein n=1 Tax=Kitasatospora cheerisanensis KCTC 2395 TaxID=1348663 RepID=A0A066Z5Q4_9ACTN|nr:hypothetical protein [Kitasatospora cheerisanensis]KDN87584.1 hypothetical protein KCH_06940 [Kitasatospora cheerisanensis KCTC 2395]
MADRDTPTPAERAREQGLRDPSIGQLPEDRPKSAPEPDPPDEAAPDKPDDSYAPDAWDDLFADPTAPRSRRRSIDDLELPPEK